MLARLFDLVEWLICWDLRLTLLIEILYMLFIMHVITYFISILVVAQQKNADNFGMFGPYVGKFV